MIRSHYPTVLGHQATQEGLLQVQPQEQPQEGILLRACEAATRRGGQERDERGVEGERMFYVTYISSLYLARLDLDFWKL